MNPEATKSYPKTQKTKKIIAYVNTVRVHWLVEELQAIGIKEIMVTEFFKPQSQISRLELVCAADAVEDVRRVIHQIGTNGGWPDHYIEIKDYDPTEARHFPPGGRVSKLEG